MKRSPLKRRTELRSSSTLRGKPRQRNGPQAPVERTCRTCGQTFTIGAAAAARGEGRYCSRECWPRKVVVERVCENCGRTFAVEERQVRKGRGRFCSRACANGPTTGRDGKKPRRRRVDSRRFRSGQPRCVHPDCEDPLRPSHEHHVVYEQHVVRAGGDISDPRNALRLCVACHSSHHRRGRRVVPLVALRDVNLDFAFELMGPGAYDYLRRRYAGDDPRLDERLRRFDQAAAELPRTDL